jgi:glycosyltransferase involved in cell wall biosynthesis
MHPSPLPSLAVLAPFVPHPPLSGSAMHIAGAVRALAAHYRVSLAAVAADPLAADWGPLAAYCERAEAFAPSPAPRLWWPLPSVRGVYSARLARTLAERWRREPPAVVELALSDMAQYSALARRSGALVVCTATNVAFFAQARRARAERDPARRWRRWLGAVALWSYELRALGQCHLVVTHSPADAAALRPWLRRTRVEYMTSGIDLDRWPERVAPPPGDAVLFVGNYQHPPNVEGALWLAREVWPRVLAARPQARLTLAGRAPTPAIRALAGASVAVPGALDDLGALYAASGVAVAPIFWGSGVRIKLLEALASGLPVVATPLAAEGIPLRAGESALFADDPAGFAAAIARLLDDEALRARVGAAGRAVVARHYDWRAVGRRLAGLYEGLRAGIAGEGPRAKG